ncbi:MAG: hypothetical protein CVV05_07640 [Gammaproteobacteria bacterium HGW-Gammaproteobacteria-1]|jgi:hypothetical protein|nr:MAG: hypothetical protein CVV05_07640 [Gammaproteobacteria bacterium HGW-Gammaproteobacteria-1]
MGMSENTFAVVFTGQLVEGAAAEQVKANFARLFKVEMEKVAPMFTGKPVTIKRGVDAATARKYQQALQQAGAVCSVVDQAAPAPAPATPPVSAAPAAPAAAAAAGLNATLAEPGALLKEPEPVEEARIDVSHLSMGAVGETLVEPETVPEFEVDLSALTMAEAGVDLTTPGAVEPPQFTFDALSLAEPGALLQEPEEVAAPAIDTSRISLA